MLGMLRSVGIVFGLAMIFGELWRSWGVDRPAVFVVDDVVMGLVLILASLVIWRDTTRRRAFLAAAWGMNAGMLFGSFFGKLYTPAAAEAGNWNLGALTALIGVAFAVACIGTALSILLSRQ